ncbi:MAG: Gfo/Idh/MocA family oxidoreductase [Caldilineaceae bacterium]
MAPQTYRVAFIGAGTIVRLGHIPNFQRLPNVETVAVCDVNEARVKELAAATNIPQTFTDYKEMLTKAQPDITVIATPNIFHKPMAIDALNAGSHVLCEKPLALTYADATEMFDAAAANGRTLTVGTHYRWSDPMQMAKAHANAGFFGRIYAARTVWHRRSGIPGYGSWFTNKDLAGGGGLLDIGVHALDRALYIMDYPQPVTVSGALFSELGPRGLGLGGWGSDIFKPDANTRFDVDDLAWAFVRFENGAVLQFQVSWAVNYADTFGAEIMGTEGGAYIGDRDKVELYTTLNGQRADIKLEMPRNPTNSYQKLVENFVRYLDGDTNAEIVTRAQALTSVKIVDGIMRSAQSGHEVDV